MILWRRVFVERRATMLALTALLAVNAAVLMLAVLPLRGIVAGNADQVARAKLTLADAQAKKTRAETTRSSRDRTQADLKKFYADILPPDFSSARRITHMEIARIGQECGLRAGPRDFDPARLRDSPLGEFKTAVSFTGEYASIRKFIYQLETSPSFLVIRSIELGQASQSKGQSGGSLGVTLQISTFYMGDK